MGALTEGSQECSNKVVKDDRAHHVRKTKIEHSHADLLNNSAYRYILSVLTLLTLKTSWSLSLPLKGVASVTVPVIVIRCIVVGYIVVGY